MILSEAELIALWLSLKVAATVIVFGLPLAFGIALLIANSSGWRRQIGEAFLLIPLVMPPVVVGYILLILFQPNGWLGRTIENVFGFSFAFAWPGAALAAFIMGLPLMVRAILGAIEAIDPRLFEAAATLGANRRQRLITILLPLTRRGILGAATLGFARSLGEFGATITFVANIPGETRTIPLALFTAIQTPGGEPMALRLMILSLSIALLASVAAGFLTRRRRRR